ncbi:MAG: MFS transporter [Candidatus Dojkabacteria bacterium]|nr:MAG: MFS transporter [Candidatus Dojkabacteria bacterium]
MNQSLTSNIWKYAVLLITNKRVWVSIIAVYYLTIPGVNELGISYIILAGNVAGVLFEIPSGYLADQIGHKKTLVLSRIFAVISSIFYLMAWDLWTLIAGSVFLSLSVAFMSGTGNAFMLDTLKNLGREHEYAKIMGKIKSIGFSLPLLISMFVPFLAEISIKAPFVAGIVMDVIGLVVSLLFIAPKVIKAKVEDNAFRDLLRIVKQGISIGFVKYSVYLGVLGGLIFAIGNYRGPYQASLGIPIIYFGLFFGLGRGFASILLWFSGKIQKRFTMKQFFFWQTILYGLIFLVLGTGINPWVLVILFAFQNGLKWGLTEIEDSYFIDLIKDVPNKATLLSFGSQIQQIIGGIAALLVGWIIVSFGYQQGFLFFGIIFSVIMLAMYWITFSRTTIKKNR